MSEQLALDFELTREESTLLCALKPGRENARQVGLLAAMLGTPQRRIRQVIRHLIDAHGCCIGSAVQPPHGFYLAVTKEEVDVIAKGLRHRALSVLFRVSKLQHNSLEQVFHQARLEFEGTSNEL